MRKYLILGALTLGMPACELLTTDCGKDVLPHYDVQGIKAHVNKRPVGQHLQGVAEGNTVTSQELRLSLALEERYYAARPASGFLSAAHACDVEPNGFRGTKERMDSLSITSLYDYDARHPAGTPLTDILGFDSGAQWELPSRQNPKEPFRSVELTLKAPPATAGTQKFRVYYRQTNGEVYTAETAAITLLP